MSESSSADGTDVVAVSVARRQNMKTEIAAPTRAQLGATNHMLRLAASASARRVGSVATAARPLAARSFYSAPKPTEGAVKIDFDVPYDLHKLEEIGGPATYTYATKKELIEYFSLMYRMRRMEIAADTLYKGKGRVYFADFFANGTATPSSAT